MLRNREVLLVTASYFCSNYLFYFFFNWLFIYLVQSRGFTMLEGGFYAAAPWLTGALGAVLGGWGCDRLVKRIGPRWGYAVMAADIAKAAAAARIGRRIAGDTGQHVAAVAAVLGHCYPITKKFQGGKGVGCSVGQCLATLPGYLPADLAVATAVAAGPWRQRAFTATAVSSAVWVTAATLWWRRGWPNAWGGTPTVGLPLAAAATSAVIFQRFAASRQAYGLLLLVALSREFS